MRTQNSSEATLRSENVREKIFPDQDDTRVWNVAEEKKLFLY